MTDEGLKVTAVIELTWGGEPRRLPILPMGPADAWRKLFGKKFPENAAEEVDGATAMTEAGKAVLDLMLAYDRSKVLGTREWIRENVTDDEMGDAFVEVWRRSFRYSRLPRELMQASLGSPQPARSLSGLLPTGTLIPTTSANGSPTSS